MAVLHLGRVRRNLGTAFLMQTTLWLAVMVWIIYDQMQRGIRMHTLEWSLVAIVLSIAVRPLMLAYPNGFNQFLQGFRFAWWGTFLFIQFSDIRLPLLVYQLLFPAAFFYVASLLLLHSTYDAAIQATDDGQDNEDNDSDTQEELILRTP